MQSLSVLTDRVRRRQPNTARGRDRACVCRTASRSARRPSRKRSPPGLPRGMNWTFNFDASWGAFGFADSLYTNPKPEQPSGDLSDNWFEGSIKPALSPEYTTASSAQFYGKFSGVGERTYGAPPTLVGEDASSFDVEDLYVRLALRQQVR